MEHTFREDSAAHRQAPSQNKERMDLMNYKLLHRKRNNCFIRRIKTLV